MKKNRRQLILLIFLGALWSSSIFGQTLSCNDMINATLDDNGEMVVYPEMITESIPPNAVLQVFNKDTGEGGDFLSLNCDDIGSFNIEVVDQNTGNSCWGGFTVEDKLPPTPYAANNTVVSLNGGNSVTVSASTVDLGSYDECSIASVTLNPSTFTSAGTYTATLTVTDQSGNSDFATSLITVVNGIPACNGSLYVSLDPLGQATLSGDPFLEGNADYDLVELSLDNINFDETVSFDCDDIDQTQTVYVHIENDGNSYNCTTDVMVDDKLAPVAIVESDFTINLETETETYILSIDDVDDGSYDNCPNITRTISQSEFTIDDWGQNAVVLTVEDASGQSSSATTIVTVLVDGQAPPLECVTLSTAVTSTWGPLELWAQDFVLNYADYDQVLASLDPAGPFTESFIADCGINGGDPYTVYIKAISGQSEDECFVELTVVDNTPPVAIAKQNIALQLLNGSATLFPATVDNGSYDFCTDVVLSLSQTTFTTADLGINKVWLTVTDLNGNENQTWTNILVTDGSDCILSNVIFPEDININDENGTVDDLSIENLQAQYGYTYKEVHPYTISSCSGIAYGYGDQIVNSAFGHKVFRNFTAIDWFTNEIVTHVQILKLNTSFTNVLACNDNITISLNNGTATVSPMDVLEGGPYNYDNVTLSIEDSDMNIILDNIITSEYIGEVLIYTVTDIVTGNFCWGNISVEEGVEGCALDDEDVFYPLDNIYLPEFNLDPQVLSPDYLVANYGYEMSEVKITWEAESCVIVGYSFVDDVFDYGNGSFKIVRAFTAIDWTTYEQGSTEGIWTYTQVINAGIDQSSLICDVLPRTADVGDCDSGHTLDDDVEWPADLLITDYRITPAELIDFSGVDVLDSEPSFYNNVAEYSASYVDLLVELNNSTLVIGRVWTVSHATFGFTWTYNQTITVDFSDFENLVNINTGTNRAMPGVEVNEAFFTNLQGNAFVNGEPINSISYEDDYYNGVNLLDLVLVQRHILGLGSLPEYGIIAADINGDQQIKASDLGLLRKNLLAVNLKDKGEWEFYNKEIDTPISVLPKGVFVGVKIGDVNDSALLQDEEAEEPDSKFEIIDVVLNKGENYSIPVYIAEQIDAFGVDFRAIVDNDFINVNAFQSNYTINENSYNITEEGNIYLNFSTVNEILELGGGLSNPVFTIEITAKENSLLSAALDLDTRLSFVVSSDLELITMGGEIGNMIGTGTNSEELSNLAVYPNPTTDYLNIDLQNVDVRGAVEVSIYELNGQRLSTSMNESRIDVSNLASGMYYYQVKIDTYTTTGKFIVID